MIGQTVNYRDIVENEIEMKGTTEDFFCDSVLQYVNWGRRCDGDI